MNPFFQIPSQTDPFFRLFKPIVVLPVDKVALVYLYKAPSDFLHRAPVSAMIDREILITFTFSFTRSGSRNQ